MRKKSLIFTLFLSLGLFAIEPGDRVENFRLLDQKGSSHELFYYSDQKALVFLESVQTSEPQKCSEPV